MAPAGLALQLCPAPGAGAGAGVDAQLCRVGSHAGVLPGRPGIWAWLAVVASRLQLRAR